MNTSLQSVANRIAEIESRVASMASIGSTGGVVGAQSLEFDAALSAASSAGATTSTGGRTLSSMSSVIAAPSVAASSGDWVSRLPAAGQKWSGQVEAAARQHGIDPELLGALVWAESGYDPSAVSHAGAIGLGQLMPGTAAGLDVDPYDPAQNLDGAARYLREQLDRFGSAELALAAYNAGPNRVAQAGGIPRIAETQAYVPRVMDYYAQLKGAA